MEDTVKETTQKHAAFIQKLKNQVVTTKEENTQLKDEVIQLQESIDAMNEERERNSLTNDVKDDIKTSTTQI